MEYTYLGDTGMKVSQICLGCMSFGSSDWREWVLDEDESQPIIERAIDLGVNFFDTANVYSAGESERVLGDALEGRREQMVVASKVFFRMDDDNNFSGGLSRKAIEQEVAHSLDRLGMDAMDLLQIHRRDRHTPTAETLRALDDVVRRNQARYLGASSMWAYQFADALHASERLGLERFATMQNHYNLLFREEEREMLPLCQEKGVGVIPWSPLARGWVARPHEDVRSTTRAETDDYAHEHPYYEGGGREINERVQELAAEEGLTMAQVAIAWLLSKDWVDAPIVGTTSVEHLEEAVEATEVDLAEDDAAWLEEPYEPLPVSGHE